MPTTLLLGKDHELRDLKSRLKARNRTALMWAVPILVALPLGVFCGIQHDASHTDSGRAFFAVMSIFLLGVGVSSSTAAGYALGLKSRDLSAMLRSESVAAVPILAEYHAYFSAQIYSHSPYLSFRDRRPTLPTIRAQVLHLLRSDWEASQMEFSASSLIALIKMMEVIEETDDLSLILKVIAQVGTPASFSHLDIAAKKIYGKALKDDNQAKHSFLLQVAECKTAIRIRQSKLQEAQSLLRGSAAPDILLRPAYPQADRGEKEHLLRAGTE